MQKDSAPYDPLPPGDTHRCLATRGGLVAAGVGPPPPGFAANPVGGVVHHLRKRTRVPHWPQRDDPREVAEMTALLEPDSSVVVANAADLRSAIAGALERAGCTFDELADQARSGDFNSIQARLAWVAIGDLYDVDLDSAY